MKSLLQDYVTRVAASAPGSTAVIGGDGEALDYRRLEELSSRLACLLEARGCRPGDRVCILGPKRPRSLVAILGVLKAGGIYVPLDPGSPAPRTASMVRRCDTPWLLAHGPVGTIVRELAGQPGVRDLSVGWLDEEPDAPAEPEPAFTWADVVASPEAVPLVRSTPGDPAYILFTSGSTGEPKGVVVTHANVRAFIGWAVSYFGIGPEDRLSGHAPLHFDLSVFDVFGAAAAGAELHLVPRELSLIPHRTTAFMRERALTQWFSVPSLLTYMAGADALGDDPDPLPSLRRLIWCGEVFPTPSLVYWMRRLPSVRFTNLYGPTEATIASSYHTVPEPPTDETEPVPIGRACPGEELLVLDDELRPVPPGEVGSLYIRGVGLSLGYWRDPERTREAFVPDPDPSFPGGRIYRTGDLARMDADGVCHFLGRADMQVKARGHRIELGEIETALDALSELHESIVVGVPTSSFEGTRICCAYVSAAGHECSPALLRRSLRTHLPAYMLPDAWLEMEELPRNANGKIDRRAIRELFQDASVRESLTHAR